MSSERILVTHAGSLPRPDDLAEMIWAGIDGEPVGRATLDARIDSAVREVVEKQRAAGVDLVSDGELSKSGFSTYVNDRFSGSRAVRSFRPTTSPISPISRCAFLPPRRWPISSSPTASGRSR
jgi:methionine synthase II (cobalamin-independent)